LKYVYVLSMRPKQESLYVAIIIGVNAMVYALCNMTEAIQLVTDIRVFCESDVLGVQIGFTKF